MGMKEGQPEHHELQGARELTEGEFLVEMDAIISTTDDKEVIRACRLLISKANGYINSNLNCRFYATRDGFYIVPVPKGKIGFRGMK